MVSMLIMTSRCSFDNTGNDLSLSLYNPEPSSVYYWDVYMIFISVHLLLTYEIFLLAVYRSFTLKNLCHCYCCFEQQHLSQSVQIWHWICNLQSLSALMQQGVLGIQIASLDSLWWTAFLKTSNRSTRTISSSKRLQLMIVLGKKEFL